MAILLSIMAPLAVCSAIIVLRVRHLQRLPVAESLRCYAAKVGQESLYQHAFVAVFCLALQVWLRMTSLIALVCLGYFILNGAVAVCALRFGAR